MILRPTTPERFDVVASDGSRFYRVQIKTGRWDRRGSAPALKASFDTPYSPTDVDVIAVVDIDAESVYYVKATDVEDSTNVTFRFDNHAGTTSAFRANECMRFPYDTNGGNE